LKLLRLRLRRRLLLFHDFLRCGRIVALNRQLTARAQTTGNVLLLIVLHGAHDVVVRVGERCDDDLAFRRVRIAAQRAAGRAADDAAECAEVHAAGAAFCGGDLHAGAIVDDGQQRAGFLRVHAAGERTDGGADTARQKAGHAGAGTAGVVVGERDRRADGVIGGNHLALAEVRLVTQFARILKGALAHDGVHAAAAIDHDEAVRLLHQELEHGHRGAQFVLTGQHAVPRGGGVFDDGDRAERAVALFELLIGVFRVRAASRASGSRLRAAAAHVHGGATRRDACCEKQGGDFYELVCHFPSSLECCSGRWAALPGSMKCRAGRVGVAAACQESEKRERSVLISDLR